MPSQDSPDDTFLNSSSPPQLVALRGEALACQHLQSIGFTVEAVNWRAGRLAEIDVIASHPLKQLLVFVEVKTRHPHSVCTAYDALAQPSKQRRWLKAVSLYMQGQPMRWQAYQPRLDLIVVTYLANECQRYRLEHLENILGDDHTP
ncbi:MAG: YraN family protein [Candidatus Melainabacteria bacterium]|nr:YraN family protein [Candidatus Melainabacteria bacterium]